MKGKDKIDLNKSDINPYTLDVPVTDKIVGESIDECILEVIKEENPQLFQYVKNQLEKYSTSEDKGSLSRVLQMIGLDFQSKVCKDIHMARVEKHSVIALLDNDKYCIVKGIKDGFVHIYSIKEGKVTQKVSVENFEKLYLGRILVIKNLKGAAAEQKDTKYFWFWNVIKRYRSFYANVLLAAFVINIFGLIIPLFAMNVYDRVIPNNSIETLWALSTGVLLIIIFDFALKMLRAYFVENTSRKIDLKLSNILFAKALHLFMKDQTDPVGVRANRIRDFDSVRDFFSSVTLVGIIDFPFLLITLVLVWFIGGLLVMVPLVILIIAMLATFAINGALDKYTKRSVEGLASKNSLLFETLFNIETIKNFSMQPYMMNKWDEDSKAVSKAVSSTRFLSTFIVNFLSSLGFLCSVLVVLLGTHLIWSSDLTMGGLIACSILAGRCLAPITQMTTIINRYQQVRCSLDSLDTMMMMEDERKGIKEFYTSKIGRDIGFHNMCFAYPNQSGEFFDNISFTIKEGEKVAILGNSGSGKSTLFKLMTGLYAPKDGSISISGVNMMQIDPYILRSNIGYVEQNSRLFRGTLWSNLIVKNPKITEEEALRIIDLAGIDSFAKQHPDGYNMKIDEAGSSLSGGQIQAIVLARALVNDPQIILLDEPTNFMDNRLENNFVTKIKKFAEGKTMVIATHKRALLDLVDRIIVVDEGKIVADNNKDIILKQIFN